MVKEEEFSDSEDEGDGRKDSRSYKEPSLKKRPRLNKDDLGKHATPSPPPSGNTTIDNKPNVATSESAASEVTKATPPASQEAEKMETGNTERLASLFLTSSFSIIYLFFFKPGEVQR